jgi:hypothetical protein
MKPVVVNDQEFYRAQSVSQASVADVPEPRRNVIGAAAPNPELVLWNQPGLTWDGTKVWNAGLSDPLYNLANFIALVNADSFAATYLVSRLGQGIRPLSVWQAAFNQYQGA